MTKSWPKVRLGEVLTPIARAETVDATKDYKLLGVRLAGHGPFLRECVSGAETAARTLFRVAAGDFIYSRLFACRGAFGVIDAALDGCYVSSEFPTFRPVAGRVCVDFLRYWFRLPGVIGMVDEDCSGSTPLTRNRFKEQFFNALEIPLPPLAEQRRIVGRIEKLAGEIEAARRLRAEAMAEAEGALICMAHRADLTSDAKLGSGWRRVRLGDAMHQVDDSHRVDGSRSYPNLGIFSYARGLFHKPPIEGAATSATHLRRVRKGQFIYSRLFAFEGAYGVVSPEFDGHFVSNEYPTFECDPAAMLPEFIGAYFGTPSVWRTVAVGSKGIGHRRQRVQPGQLLSHDLWLPPMPMQRQLAAARQHFDMLKAVQAETAAELDALLPAILDRAFKGEL